MKLSITMIMKNEENNLDRCLSSMQPILDAIDTEIVIIDTGSTDRSVEIAKKYTDKVYFFKWINDFGAARNFGIEKCSGDWIFIIDADEKIINHDKFIEIFNSPKINEYDVVDVLTYNIVNSSTGAFTHCHNYRFIKNIASNRYVENLHAYIPTNNAWYTEEVLIYHYGYDNSDKELMLEKSDRNLEYLLKEYEELGQKTTALKLSQIADAYNVVHKSEQAYDFVKKTLAKALAEENYLLWLSYIAIELRTLINLKQYDKIFIELDKYEKMKSKLSIKFVESDISIYCSVYTAYKNLELVEGIIEFGEKYIYYLSVYNETPNKFKKLNYSTVANSSIYIQATIHLNLVKYYIDMQEYEKAKSYLEKDIYIKPVEDNLLNIKGLIDNYIKLSTIYDDMNYRLLFDTISATSNFELTMEFILSDEYTTIERELKDIFISKLIRIEARLISNNPDILTYLSFINLKKRYENNDDFIPYLEKNISSLLAKAYTYTDLLYYHIKLNLSFDVFESSILPINIEKVVDNCFKLHDDLSKIFLAYNLESTSYYSNLYVISILDRCIIEENNSNFESYIFAIKYYINSMIFMKTTYNENMIKDKMISYLPFSAQKIYNINKIFEHIIHNNYVDALKEMQIILKNNSYLKPLANNMNELISNLSSNDELLQLTTNFKKTICDCILPKENNKAKDLLEEYSKVNPSDTDIEIIKKSIN